MTAQAGRWLRTVEDLAEISQWVPQTQLILVGDRESDLFELFDYRRRKARNIHLLVRAHYNRCLKDESAKLFDHLEALPVMGKAQIEVPRQREKKGQAHKARTDCATGSHSLCRVALGQSHAGRTRHRANPTFACA